ncbi:MAG TPA: hypothetical protein VJ694_00050 [Patescibacteria group bacterium]|nr:hypothetical protein [Patescibacteria group bacterium]
MMRFLFGRKKPAPAPAPPLAAPDPLAGFYAEAEAAGRRYDEERARAAIAIEPATHDEWVADGEIALSKKVPDALRARMTSLEPSDPERTDLRRLTSRRP